MKKEIIIAIIVGIVFGTIITFGAYTARRSLQNRDQVEVVNPSLPESNPPEEANHTITINSPQTEEIIQENPVEISGFTSPQSMISAITDNDQAVTVADAQGAFAVILNLENGANQTTVTSFDPEGEEASQTLILVYTDTNLENPESNEDNEALDENTQTQNDSNS